MIHKMAGCHCLERGFGVWKGGLERAAGIEPASSVWKTEVLTITQRPRAVVVG